jgi:hypothetical protein
MVGVGNPFNRMYSPVRAKLPADAVNRLEKSP